MSTAKEIRNKIKSIKNTQKITKAMEMVAASKMRRAQERMRHARPYGEKVRDVCAHLASANSEYRHPFLNHNPEATDVGLIIITSDKGLCGGLNTNVLRLATTQMREWENRGQSAKVTVVGGKGAAFMRRVGGTIISEYISFGDKPQTEDLIGATKIMLDVYRNGDVGEVHLLYTRFVNTVKQDAVSEQLLPVPEEQMQDDKSTHTWDYLYEPEAPTVIDLLLTRYIESVVYQAVAENVASEQAARMVAMKAASDNAGNLIDELQLAYNKSRQASITQEISEIVGGAAAI